jgi:S-adenosylmethionine:tRNA ribosyltransferase-isomerase
LASSTSILVSIRSNRDDRRMRTADFGFDLPPELIAQVPAPGRDESRLLVLHRSSRAIEHRRFAELPEYLHPGDVLALNDSRVIPARLRGVNVRTGGRFEVLLLEENDTNDWWVMLRPGRRARVGTEISFQDLRGRATAVQATVIRTNLEGHRQLRFTGVSDLREALNALGEVPLPPYINRKDASLMESDRERYQTVFSQAPGSVAAPTAGLHFTRGLLDRIRSRHVEVCFVTLHVGLGTFAPVKSDDLTAHVMHEERYELSAATADRINLARQTGGRVVAVGTTTLRVLETVAGEHQGRLVAGSGRTRLFIYPPREFRIVDALLTNFHLPRSTLLMLVSAFAAPKETRGVDLIRSAYAEAIRERYRFFSYGDAMFIAG